MKVKEINLTANIAWSPKGIDPIHIACGTSTQNDSSTGGSSLQVYNLNLGESNLETRLIGSTPTPARFHKISWGDNANSKGFIAGGCENNSVYVYDADKLVAGEESLCVSLEGKHSGPVYSVDFNSFQSKLLASGSSDSEIFIWDITKPEAPMTPGSKSNVSSNVTCVSWNRQVEHILAATFGDRCVVYDLKKNSSIVQISESVSRIRPHSLCWHPTMATQLILASDVDQTPVCQVWDLRYSTAPIRTLSGHQRGVISAAWCSQDQDIFITSGKDNRILVWNPNFDKSGEIVGELPSYNQWSYDLSISPRDPSLVATSSIDGSISVYSLLGGGIPPKQTDKFSAIADSFPGMEIPSTIPQAAEVRPIHLKNPPKWLPKRAGVRFSFGGGLVSWNSASRTVEISQVVTEPDLVNRSQTLESALSMQDLGSYCSSKSIALQDNSDQVLWQFIGATFTSEGLRDQYMTLLGYYKNQIAMKVRPQDAGPSPEELAAKMATLSNNDGSTSSLDPSEQFEMIASAHSLDKTPEAELHGLESESTASTPVLLEVTEETDGLIRHALLLGDFESAIELCVQEGNNCHALMLAIHAGGEVYYKTRDRILKLESRKEISSLVGALVQHDLTSVVTSCDLQSWKEALVALLTYATEEEFPPLVELLGERLESETDPSHLHHAMICYICAGSLNKFVSCWIKTQPDIDNSPSNLQDLVEIMMVLQKGLTSIGRIVNLSESSSVSYHMCQYASLLAAQGALSTAASYLGNATQGEMLSLRDRVYRALGTNASHVTSTVPVTSRNRSVSVASNSSQHHHISRRTSTPQPQPFQPQQFTPSVQAQQTTFQPSSSPMAPIGFPMANPVQSFNQQPLQNVPAYSSSIPQYGGAPPMQPMSPQIPSVPPPIATGTGGMRRSAGSRYHNDVPANNQNNPIPGMFNPSQSQSMPSASPFNVPQASIRPFEPITSQPNMYGMSQPNLIPQPTQPNLAPPTNILEPQQQLSSGYPQAPSMTPAALDSSVPRGWNDPPPLSTSKKIKNQQQKLQTDQIKPMQPVQPIMNPVMGSELPPQYQGFQGFQGGSSPAQQAPTQTPQIIPQVEKANIPSEHQIIQSVLDGIRTRGLLTVQNMVAKQRLENLGTKIEVLYDKLRSGQVTAPTLAGLHDIVAAVQTGDYHRALQVHTVTVASGNFSEMSQYMPPLKMLLTTCMQFQVFLQ